MTEDEQSVLILTSDDVSEVVRRTGCDAFMDRLIEALGEAFSDFKSSEITVPVRDGFHYNLPTPGLVEWMPLYRHGEAVLMKMVGYHPENPVVRKRPTVLSTLSRYETTTGRLTDIVDGELLTAIRTGAASAVATGLLAPDNARTLGLIGCGAQAVTQLHGLSRVRTLESIYYFDTDPMVMESFPTRVRPLLDPDVRLIPSSVQSVVASSDILCTATSVAVGAGPVFEDRDMSPTVHINAVGSDLAGKTETPLELLARSFVCPDFPEQARLEGECQQLSLEQIGPSLMEVVRRPEQWPDVKERPTVFDSTGWALEDYVAFELARTLAVELGVGKRLRIEATAGDPWNPYQGLVAPELLTVPLA